MSRQPYFGDPLPEHECFCSCKDKSRIEVHCHDCNRSVPGYPLYPTPEPEENGRTYQCGNCNKISRDKLEHYDNCPAVKPKPKVPEKLSGEPSNDIIFRNMFKKINELVTYLKEKEDEK